MIEIVAVICGIALGVALTRTALWLLLVFLTLGDNER